MPAYNEQEVLGQTYQRFVSVRPTLEQLGLDHELVLHQHDGSRDRTPTILDDLAAADPHVASGSSDKKLSATRPPSAPGLTVIPRRCGCRDGCRFAGSAGSTA